MRNMTVHVIEPNSPIEFPPVESAKESGLLAVGGDLAAPRLIHGYAQGIFPWYGAGGPIMWWCPDPRCVLFPQELHIPTSLKKEIKKSEIVVTQNMAFEAVIYGCSRVSRPFQNGTWLQPELIEAYTKLHKMGFAHSVEAWEGNNLVGGLYGVVLGSIFFGESMFYLKPNSSKIAFVSLVQHLQKEGFTLIDCQQTTQHLLRFGAREIPRKTFMQILNQYIKIK